MKQSAIQNRFVLGLLFAALLSGCIGRIGRPVDSESQIRNLTIETVQAKELSGDTQATIVHIDPQTGQMMVPPVGASTGYIQQPQTNTLVMSPLRETVSPAPNGGVMIYLDERFVTPLMATIDKDGKPQVGHNPVTTDSDDKK
jgi:hypothetical protein